MMIRNRRRHANPLFLATLLSALVLGGCARQPTDAAPPVAASNAYLEAATLDLLGHDTSVLRLAEPGTCPGHFDLRTSQVNDLRRCRLLLRFDFQQGLDAKLRGVQQGGLHIAGIRGPAGLCIPASYVATCRQVAEAFTTAGLLSATQAADRLAAIERECETLQNDAVARVQAAGLAGAAVITSDHQAAFCEALGLRVVARLRGADTALVDEIESALRDGKAAAAVIANRPEGRGLADAVGTRLKIPVVMFDNFPTDFADAEPFAKLVTTNVDRLIEAAGR